MPYDVNIGDGADALGQNQLSDALDGTYWVSGWDATLGTGSLEVDIAAGEGAVDGTTVTTASTQTIDFTGDPDATDPRKAVIYVDATGTVQKSLGTPQPVDPTGEIRFRTWNPSPPASVSGVVVAEVWLAANETTLASADIRDRRVANDAADSLGGFTIAPSGYQDVTASRSANTTYTNTTGEALEVVVTAEQSNASLDTLDVQLRENTVTIDQTRIRDSQEGEFATARGIIAPGEDYEAVALPSLDTWFEQELTIS